MIDYLFDHVPDWALASLIGVGLALVLFWGLSS